MPVGARPTLRQSALSLRCYSLAQAGGALVHAAFQPSLTYTQTWFSLVLWTGPAQPDPDMAHTYAESTVTQFSVWSGLPPAQALSPT